MEGGWDDGEGESSFHLRKYRRSQAEEEEERGGDWDEELGDTRMEFGAPRIFSEEEESENDVDMDRAEVEAREDLEFQKELRQGGECNLVFLVLTFKFRGLLLSYVSERRGSRIGRNFTSNFQIDRFQN